MSHDIVYAVKGPRSDQAESSTKNRAAATMEMRILIELQVISYLLHQSGNQAEDLAQIRQSVADSIS